ncbi:Uncharacterized protein TCM_036558 [Theobroma cacao]|uniref:Uncharacterized protein n=1 Tax=Theobroma cacao TaxID=3641 RepID=A0A061FJY5_THECC|nr:Uncharacterized protein TCM_036558 [Theobroma cacao]
MHSFSFSMVENQVCMRIPLLVGHGGRSFELGFGGELSSKSKEIVPEDQESEYSKLDSHYTCCSGRVLWINLFEGHEIRVYFYLGEEARRVTPKDEETKESNGSSNMVR